MRHMVIYWREAFAQFTAAMAASNSSGDGGFTSSEDEFTRTYPAMACLNSHRLEAFTSAGVKPIAAPTANISDHSVGASGLRTPPAHHPD